MYFIVFRFLILCNFLNQLLCNSSFYRNLSLRNICFQTSGILSHLELKTLAHLKMDCIHILYLIPLLCSYTYDIYLKSILRKLRTQLSVTIVLLFSLDFKQQEETRNHPDFLGQELPFSSRLLVQKNPADFSPTGFYLMVFLFCSSFFRNMSSESTRSYNTVPCTVLITAMDYPPNMDLYCLFCKLPVSNVSIV